MMHFPPQAIHLGVALGFVALSAACAADPATSTATAPTAHGYVTIQDRQLQHDGAPFFPVGFVMYDKSDAALEAAIRFGANSLHDETSIRDIYPDTPQGVNEKALQEITDRLRRAEAHHLTSFLMLNGHYIPGWLHQRAGGPPVNAKGEKIGLWFEHSLHHPAFRGALENYWRTVSRAVAGAPGLGALITWNEPGYGLDYSPYALADFRAWLEKRYGGISRMNAENGTTFAAFSDVQPPRAPDENRRFWYAWACFNQEAFASFFAHERDVVHAAAPALPLSGKHPATALLGDGLLCNDVVLQATAQDLYGCDGYNGSLFHYRDAMEAARSLSGGGPVITYETHPQASTPPLPPAHDALQLFVQLIGGCRGMFYYCLDPINNFGFTNAKATPPAQQEAVASLFRLIRANQSVFAAPRAPAPIAVLLANPSVIHYGMGEDSTRRDDYSKRVAQTFDMLRNQHFAVDVISDRQLADKLDSYQALVIPSLSILSEADLARVAAFHARGGKILAFGKSLARNEWFEPIPTPAFFGMKSRRPSPWNRGQMRLTSAVPALSPSFDTELIVQEPEIVDALPMEQAIPGYVAKTRITSQALVGNQDAYPSVIQSTDGQVIYCAFDSLYSEGLSRLLGGIVADLWQIPREVSVTRNGVEALSVMTALNRSADTASFLVANAGPNPGRWNVSFMEKWSGRMRNIATGKTLRVQDGRCSIALPGYGYAVYEREKAR